MVLFKGLSKNNKIKSKEDLKNILGALLKLSSEKGHDNIEQILNFIGDKLLEMGVYFLFSVLNDKRDELVIKNFSAPEEYIDFIEAGLVKKLQNKSIYLSETISYLDSYKKGKAVFVVNRFAQIKKYFDFENFNFPKVDPKIKSIIIPLIVENEVIAFLEFFSQDMIQEYVSVFDDFGHRFLSRFANIVLYKEARRSEERYKDIFENSREGFCVLDCKNKKLLEVNHSFCKLTAYTEGELMQINYLSLFPDKEKIRINSFIKNGLKGKLNTEESPVYYESRIITKNDIEKIVKINMSREMRGGEWFLMFSDVSETKRLEEKIYKSKKQYENIIDTIRDDICVINAEYRVVSYNKTFAEKINMPLRDIKGKKCINVMRESSNKILQGICVSDDLKLNDIVSRVLKNGNIQKIEKKIIDNQKISFFSMKFFPMLDKDLKVYQVIIIISDITQSKIDEEEIRKLHEFKKRVLDTAPISITVLDKNAKVLSLNNLAERLMGSSIIGEEIIKTKEIKNNKRLLVLFNNLLKKGKSFYFNNLPYISSNEREQRYLNIIAAPLFDAKNKVEGAISMALDNTEAMRAKCRLEEVNLSLEGKVKSRTFQLDIANQKLQEVLELKTNFISDASHELRTPLTIIQGNIDLAILEYENEKKETPELHQIVRNEINRMSGIIADLTMLSNADFKADKMLNEQVSIKKMLDSSIRSLRILAKQKNISLKNLSPNIDCEFFGDEAKLEKLFMNIIRNAIRYTDEGGKIEVVCNIQKNKELKIDVIDNGIGIPKVDIPYIFERFYRVDKARSRAEGGTGLGLSICKWIVDSHQGRIEVESHEGEGSVFSIYLPII